MTRWDAERGCWVADGAEHQGWSTAETQSAMAMPVLVPGLGGAPGSGRPAGRRVRWIAVVIVFAAVLGGGAGFGAWTLAKGDGTDRAAAADGPSAAASVSAGPATPDVNDDMNDKGENAALPENSAPVSPGYVRSVDPAGYTVDVPSGWNRTAREPSGKPVVVTYESPDGSRVLQLFEVTELTPADSLDLAENQPDYGFGRLDGFQALDRSATAAYSEIVYRFDGEGDLGGRQVVDHRFYAPDGTIYGIRSSAPESASLDEVREPIRRAVASLCPTGATCVRG